MRHKRSGSARGVFEAHGPGVRECPEGGREQGRVSTEAQQHGGDASHPGTARDSHSEAPWVFSQGGWSCSGSREQSPWEGLRHPSGWPASQREGKSQRLRAFALGPPRWHQLLPPETWSSRPGFLQRPLSPCSPGPVVVWESIALRDCGGWPLGAN